MPQPTRDQVFISYSHKDKEWLERLQTHLKPYLRAGSIKSWSDKQISPGTQWLTEIKTALTNTKVAILLVTPDFIASDFVHEYELGPFLKEAKQGGVRMLWVPVRASSYKKTALKDYQAVLDPVQPLANMTGAERDQAWVRICEEIEKAVKPLSGSSDQAGATPVSPPQSAPISNIPDRNPFFTGREAVLTQLEETLAGQRRAVLSGLGGVGKTQTVVEYAHRHSGEYVHAFWATADSREAVGSGYATIVRLLELPEAVAQDQALAVGAVQRWFSSHENWLLILDNADDLSMTREFIPPGNNGHLILTTRARATGAIARRLDIEEMETDEAALLLLRRAKYIAEDAPPNAAGEADQAKAKEIATQLDGLPLALDQAAAYIEETGCGLLGYLDLYRKHAPDLLRLRGTLDTGHPNPVASTWALSFENVGKANPAAAELLKFCAFLHPDAIPEELFREGAPELGPKLEMLGSDDLALNSAILEILKYSLLRRDPNARTLEIHRLVQAVLKQGMDETTRRSWAERAVRAVNHAFPYVGFSTWALCERLLAQAHACAELIDQWRLEFPEAAQLLNQAGSYLFARGQYAQAAPLYERGLAIYEQVLGPDDPDVATSLNNLAELYRAQGQYGKAEPLYQRSLEIREKVLGPEHPDLATGLNNLAELYRIQGQYGKAEPLHQRSLEIREKALGPEHPDLAQGLNDLAKLYYAQGQYGKAEPLYQRSLAIREMALGPEHPDVAQALHNLAALYDDQGQYGKAEPLYQRSLEIREKALGPEHPDLATGLNNLAALYRVQGQYGKAEPLYQRSLEIREKALGPEHPNMATCLNNLANLYRDRGRYAKAEPLYQRALVIWEKALGSEHPNVATCLENYALLLRRMDRPEEAATMEARARAIRAKRA